MACGYIIETKGCATILLKRVIELEQGMMKKKEKECNRERKIVFIGDDKITKKNTPR